MDEFTGFIKLGAPEKKKFVREKEVKSTLDELRVGTAIASQPTSEMRAELEAAGVVTELSEAELKAYVTPPTSLLSLAPYFLLPLLDC